MNNNLLYDGLSPTQLQELEDFATYVTEHATAGKPFPEGSLTRVVNNLSPQAQAKIRLLSDLLDTPRILPFTESRSESDIARHFGLDPFTTEVAKGVLDGEEVLSRLQDRLGRSEPDTSEPTRREQVAAAMEIHNG
jgi:hypothetical protein